MPDDTKSAGEFMIFILPVYKLVFEAQVINFGVDPQLIFIKEAVDMISELSVMKVGSTRYSTIICFVNQK